MNNEKKTMTEVANKEEEGRIKLISALYEESKKDPEKSKKIKELLIKYDKLSHTQKADCTYDLETKNNKLLPTGLGFILELSGTRGSTFTTDDPDKLLEKLQKFEKKFKQAKTLYDEQFTENKLHKLSDKIYLDSTDVDIVFLRQHTDKLNKNDIDYLESLVNERYNLLKKPIKTKKTKETIDSLSHNIKAIRDSMHSNIKRWYIDKCQDFRAILCSTIDDTILFETKDFYDLQDLLDAFKKDINMSEESLTAIIEQVEKLIVVNEGRQQFYGAKKEEIITEMKNSLGKTTLTIEELQKMILEAQSQQITHPQEEEVSHKKR